MTPLLPADYRHPDDGDECFVTVYSTPRGQRGGPPWPTRRDALKAAVPTVFDDPRYRPLYRIRIRRKETAA